MRRRSKPAVRAHPPPRRKRRGRSLLRWLSLGALGLAAATLLRGERRRLPPATDEPDSSDDGASRPGFELPLDAQASWIPGPAGTLRVVERHPTGELPIVFVHGLGGRAEQWSALLAAVGPAIRAVALDLPGHAGSDPTADGDYSIPALAAAIGATLDSLGLRRTILVGHSLGACAALDYAAKHPQRIAGLLLVDPNGDQTQTPREQVEQLLDQIQASPREELAWMFRQILRDSRPEVAKEVMEHLSSVPTEILLATFESAAGYSPLPALEQYPGPVRSVISDFNTLPYSLHRLLPNLPVSHLGQASHWLMMDRPLELWSVLVEFLDEIASEPMALPSPNGRPSMA